MAQLRSGSGNVNLSLGFTLVQKCLPPSQGSEPDFQIFSEMVSGMGGGTAIHVGADALHNGPHGLDEVIASDPIDAHVVELQSSHQLGRTIDDDCKPDVVTRSFHGLGEAVDGTHVECELAVVEHDVVFEDDNLVEDVVVVGEVVERLLVGHRGGCCSQGNKCR